MLTVQELRASMPQFLNHPNDRLSAVSGLTYLQALQAGPVGSRADET